MCKAHFFKMAAYVVPKALRSHIVGRVTSKHAMTQHRLERLTAIFLHFHFGYVV